MIVAICGIDGSGKTTHIKMLCEELKKKYRVYQTKQPTDFYRSYDRFREYVNRNLNSENIVYELALLSAADKIRHFDLELKDINDTHIIISDRYVYSAYSYFLSRGIDDIDWLTNINKYLPKPDVTIYLDVEPQIAYERIISRDGMYTKKEETDMKVMNKVREGFLNQPWGECDRYHIVSTNGDVENVHNQIIEIVNKYIMEMNLGEKLKNNR